MNHRQTVTVWRLEFTDGHTEASEGEANARLHGFPGLGRVVAQERGTQADFFVADVLPLEEGTFLMRV